jgi:hypothetical protein
LDFGDAVAWRTSGVCWQTTALKTISVTCFELVSLLGAYSNLSPPGVMYKTFIASSSF